MTRIQQPDEVRRLATEAMAAITTAINDHTLTERDAKKAMARITTILSRLNANNWDPYPWQLPPGKIVTLGTWLLLGGRGTGKTEAGSRYVDRHMNGPPCDPRIRGGHRAAIVAPTGGDAAESCVTGPSGLQTVNPSLKMRSQAGGTHVIWPNGSQARLFGAYLNEDIERLRAGGNRCLVWMEESAAMRFLGPALEHTSLGLRIGKNPHYVMSTTPKPRAELKKLIADPRTRITRGSTRDAYHLEADYRAALIEKYEGTRLGRQELDAEMLDDVEGALWSWTMIDSNRVPVAPRMDRIVVAVDPPGTSTVAGREAGIIVVGRAGTECYILSDLSGEFSPEEWGNATIAAVHRWNADAIIGETNYGGEMVKNTIRMLPGGDTVPFIAVTSSVGKQARAEPVVALYEQHRVHHVGVLAGLETQLTEWIPGESPSPDRLDALVHGATHLMIKHGPASVSTPAGLHSASVAGQYSRLARARIPGLR